jgi:DNA-binding response OmpR family regulator
MKKILIVDDEQEILTFLGNILRRANFEVFTSDRGKVALELAKNLLPDLIVLDIVMPDIPGDELAVLLSANPSTAGIPIIFLTGILTKEEESLENNTGRRYVLAKPVSPQTVLETIKKVLQAS